MMKIIKVDFQHAECEILCPYCNQVILSIGILEEDIINGSCDHLLFIYSDDSCDFLEPTEFIEKLYNQVEQASEDGFIFDEFVKVLGDYMEIENSIMVTLFGSYDALYYWFSPETGPHS